MFNFILGPREHHKISTPQEYRNLHRAVIEKQQSKGSRVSIHISEEPRFARIDMGSWIIDCQCRAGNATDPEWKIACCFGCGAIHTNIIFPPDEKRIDIERLILARPNIENRFWDPSESIDDLTADNLRYGVTL